MLFSWKGEERGCQMLGYVARTAQGRGGGLQGLLFWEGMGVTSLGQGLMMWSLAREQHGLTVTNSPTVVGPPLPPCLA